MKTIVINLFGGAGAGKSVLMARLFAELKLRYKGSVEIVTEYAKELVWQERTDELSDQHKVTGEQIKRLTSLCGKVNIVITDSPLTLGLVYTPKEIYGEIKEKIDLAKKTYPHKEINLFVKRPCEVYETAGRIHTLEQSIEADNMIKQIENFDSSSEVIATMPMDLILMRLTKLGLDPNDFEQ